MKQMTAQSGKTYDEIKDLIKRLREMVPSSGFAPTENYLPYQAANELEALHDMLCKQQVIIRRIFAEQLPDTWFVSGEHGAKDGNGLPQYIDVCPAYGVGWSQVYEKTDRTISTEGS